MDRGAWQGYSPWGCKELDMAKRLTWRTVWRSLKKLKVELPYDLAVPPLDTYLDETLVRKDTYTSIFIAVLFTIAQAWRQPQCPLTDKWIKKIWYIYILQSQERMK